MEITEDGPGDGPENRSGHLAAVIGVVPGLKENDGHGEGRLVRGDEADERGRVAAERIFALDRIVDLGSPGFAGDRVAGDGRGFSRSPKHRPLQDFDELLGRLGGDHLDRRSLVGLGRPGPPVHRLDDPRGEPDAPVGDDVDCLEKLEGRDGNLVADGDGIDGPAGPAVRRMDEAGRFGRQLDPRALSEAEILDGPIHQLGADAAADLDGSDVGRFGDDPGEGKDAERLVVADGTAGHVDRARPAVECLVGRHLAVFQGGRGGDDLEGGARVDPPAVGPVHARGRIGLSVEIRVIGGGVGQGQDLARRRIGDDHGAPGGFILGHRFFDLALGDVLDHGVDRQVDVPAAFGGDGLLAPVRPLVRVAVDDPLARLAAERVVEEDFHSGQAVVVDIHSAQDVGGQGALGVNPLRLLLGEDAGKPKRVDGGRGLELDFALDPDEGLSLIGGRLDPRDGFLVEVET